MSIETPKPSSENKLNPNPATPAEIRDIWHLEAPDQEAADSQDTASTETAENSNSEDKKEKPRKAPISERFLGSRGMQLTTLVLAGGAAIGIPTAIANNAENNAPHNGDQNTNGPITPGAEATSQPAASTTPSVETSPGTSPTNITPLETATPTIDTNKQAAGSLELSAEKYTDVQSLAEAIISERWTAWENQGATQENNDEFLQPDTNMSAAEFAASKAKENAKVFPEAIFVEGYETNANLSAIAERVTKINASTLERSLITWDDGTPYKRTMDVVGEAELVGGSIAEKQVAFKVNWINSSNAADNRISTEYDKDDVNPVTGTYTITAVVANGKWKIANIHW